MYERNESNITHENEYDKQHIKIQIVYLSQMILSHWQKTHDRKK